MFDVIMNYRLIKQSKSHPWTIKKSMLVDLLMIVVLILVIPHLLIYFFATSTVSSYKESRIAHLSGFFEVFVLKSDKEIETSTNCKPTTIGIFTKFLKFTHSLTSEI